MLSVSEAVKWLNSIKEKYIHGGDDDYRKALAMGAAALEASEPKVLSKSDVLANFHEVLFMEFKDDRYVHAVFEDANDMVWLCDRYLDDDRSIYISYNHIFVVDDGAYNISWRCWNMMPSVDQRKAVPWEVGEKE